MASIAAPRIRGSRPQHGDGSVPEAPMIPDGRNGAS